MSIELGLEYDEQRLVQLCREWHIRELALFGSVLREDFAAESDVDVLVTFEEDAPWSLWDLMRLREGLAELFGRPVDLVEKGAIRNPFRRNAILNSHRVVYAA